ncbi:MAG: transposase [Methylovulum sp.]|uniref:transposase n=1 Tax=Methylovulum sp. TaxID=1916980 RepID=UPI0026382152|nr:transposase [Methylovulum sp.]MDD2723311.1 transposase [Methylovulum sp.]MDD5126353.1 transposase [Methylovulum sp.]
MQIYTALCEAAGIDPLLAVARQEPHPHRKGRFEAPGPLPQESAPLQKMAHKLTTKAGRGAYAHRKHTVEPLCGIIESARGFRRFFLRGLAQATREWRVACPAWNLKRMAKLRQNCVYFG